MGKQNIFLLRHTIHPYPKINPFSFLLYHFPHKAQEKHLPVSCRKVLFLCLFCLASSQRFLFQRLSDFFYFLYGMFCCAGNHFYRHAASKQAFDNHPIMWVYFNFFRIRLFVPAYALHAV